MTELKHGTATGYKQCREGNGTGSKARCELCREWYEKVYKQSTAYRNKLESVRGHSISEYVQLRPTKGMSLMTGIRTTRLRTTASKRNIY
jgi:hypothetical protein